MGTRMRRLFRRFRQRPGCGSLNWQIPEGAENLAPHKFRLKRPEKAQKMGDLPFFRSSLFSRVAARDELTTSCFAKEI